MLIRMPEDAQIPPKALQGTSGSDFSPVHHPLAILAHPATKKKVMVSWTFHLEESAQKPKCIA